MTVEKQMADALMDGDPVVLDQVAARLVKPLPYNFVERPWGGTRIREYKGIAAQLDQSVPRDARLGEAFEISAYDADEEARAYPSRIRFEDGSRLALPALLRRHAERLLGPELANAHGGGFPLLPKTLCVRELLSVQGHPDGHTEAYVIIDADPGATLRVGFNRDIDPMELATTLEQGRSWQQRLLELVGDRVTPVELQTSVAPWLAMRDTSVTELPDQLRDGFAGSEAQAEALLEKLKALYWRVLDSMNEIPVEPGMVVHNANPPRIAAERGRLPTAEVHALGNPEGREILALEIRRPGPTFRAWDNVRFPLRRIDVQAAIRVLNLKRVDPEELIVPLEPVGSGAGRFRSVRDTNFELEHFKPAVGAWVDLPAQGAHGLHCVAGSAEIRNHQGDTIGALARGESAFVPVGVGAYQVTANEHGTEVVQARPILGA